jgi:ribosomal protein L11 methylase PrmA
VIIELLPAIVGKLPTETEGLLLTSGVLFADYESLVDAAAAYDLEPIDEERENEWIATTWRMKN